MAHTKFVVNDPDACLIGVHSFVTVFHTNNII